VEEQEEVVLLLQEGSTLCRNNDKTNKQIVNVWIWLGEKGE